MRAVVLVTAVAIVVALTSCATKSTVSNPPSPRSSTQALLLRTDPPGASCSISRDGVVAAAVDATPGIAHVPRGREPIEIVCRSGDLEHRTTLAAVLARDVVAQERVVPEMPKRERSAEGIAERLAASFAEALIGQALVTVVAPAIIVGGLVAAAAAAETTNPTYVFPQPPRMLLAPVVFASEAECDQYFSAMKARLEAEADAQRARIRESCHPWPCTASDLYCPNPLCTGQQARVDDNLASQLDQIPGLRARVRMSLP
jgi:hypothetical protein